MGGVKGEGGGELGLYDNLAPRGAPISTLLVCMRVRVCGVCVVCVPSVRCALCASRVCACVRVRACALCALCACPDP